MGLWDMYVESQQRTKRDLLAVEIQKFGLKNHDKLIYFIRENDPALGFFAMYRRWLEYLHFADVCGYMPVISAGKNFAYNENKAINGSKNPFEYFFEQTSPIKLSEVRNSSKVIISNVLHREMVELILTGKTNHYRNTDLYSKVMGEIAQKYMVLNKTTEDYVGFGMKKLNVLNNETLGIHIRGTDYRASYNNHPIFLGENDYFSKIDEMLEGNRYNQLFIATDDNRILSVFRKKYGNILRWYDDVKRGNSNKSVAFSRDNRENHKYLLGLEVIRDMYTLSYCKGLIAGVSQVAICAQINKYARNDRYEDLIILDKGINSNGRLFRR